MLTAVTAAPHDTPPAPPLVIAHRTAMGHAPENTLLGVRRALALGVDGIEIDVRLSADGVPVLLHDQLLERTTNGCGPVGAATLEQLKTLDAGGGERIPALAETLAAVAGRALLVVELKTSPGDDVEALSAAVLAEIESAGAMPWCWLWSFDRSAAAALSERAPPNARIAQLCLAPSAEIYQAAAELRLQGIAMHHSACSAEQAAACRAHNLASFVWTVNEPAEIKRLAALGVTGIAGDYPERIAAAAHEHS